ncbi:MAG TPA: acyl-CoA dehydrogenase family protein [Acidimicrobiales bacterium]
MSGPGPTTTDQDRAGRASPPAADRADDDLEAFRAEARAWLAAHVPRRTGPGPSSGARVAHDTSPEHLARERARQRELHEAGYVGISLPVAYGGRGLTTAHERVWHEESAGYDLPLPGGVASAVTMEIVLPTLLAHASEEQKRAWVPRILRGDELWCQLLSEPGAGSDLAGILTRATRDGDRWVLEGAKVWSSGALAADYGICLARTDWDVPKHRGLTWFKVPLDDPAVTVRPIREINGSAEFCEEFLDGVAVGDDMVIGAVNDGWAIARTMLNIERSGGAITGRGLVRGPGRRRLAPDLVALAEQRGLTDDAATRQLIARGHIADWQLRVLLERVGTLIMSGRADPATASFVKLATGRHDPERAALAMEIAGNLGVAWPEGDEAAEAPALGFLNGRIMSIAGGSNEIQRNIIGERLLGLPREPSDDANTPFQQVLLDARSWGSAGR